MSKHSRPSKATPTIKHRKEMALQDVILRLELLIRLFRSAVYHSDEYCAVADDDSAALDSADLMMVTDLLLETCQEVQQAIDRQTARENETQ